MDYYIDAHGYRRTYFGHSNLIHRQVAYHEIYLPNKDKYPLPFSKYQVHHRDGNKENNRRDNLQIVTRDQHEKIHCIKSRKGIRFYVKGIGVVLISGSLIQGNVGNAIVFTALMLELLFALWLYSVAHSLIQKPIQILRKLMGVRK